MRLVHTYCSQCRSRCGVVCWVRDGELLRVEPDRDHPNGCICTKGAAAPEIVHSPDRLRRPMVRTNPKSEPEPVWREVSWDDALDVVASNLRRIRDGYGPAAVVFGRPAPYGSAAKDYVPWLQRLANAFGSPNVMATTHICNWHRDHGAAHTLGVGMPGPDYENSRCILLWGYNPHVSCMGEALQISRARKRGAKLVVIDPRRAGAGASADLWLRVRPGADAALALAMIHVLLSEGLYDRDFVRRWTNGPYLVRRDDGALLTEADLSASGDAASFVVWDETRAAPCPCGPAAAGAGDVQAALLGDYRVPLAGGREVACATVLTLLAERAAAFAPERSQAVTWVPPQDVREAVRLFAGARPSSYATLVGLEEHANAMQINRAVSVFYALTGQFDTPGSNRVWAQPATNGIDGREFLPQGAAERRLGRRERPLGPAARPGNVQAYDVYRAAIDGDPYPVRGLVMIGGNPLLSNGDTLEGRRALQALDFYVQADMFLNPSSLLADVVLPASSPWESEAVRTSFDGGERTQDWVQLRTAAIAPLHESRPDIRIIFDLACRLGYGDRFWDGDPDAAFDHQLAPTGLTVRTLRENPQGVRVPVVQTPRKYARPRPGGGGAQGFGTPSGRIEIYSSAFRRAGHDALPAFEAPDARIPAAARDGFPLVLTTSKLLAFTHSNYRNIPSLRRQVPEPFVEVHPDTAAGLGIQEGEWVRLETSFGAIRVKTKLDRWLDPRVVCTQHGWWDGCAALSLPGYDPFTADGANANLLVPNDVVDPVSGSVPHRSYPCRVRKLQDAEDV